MQYRENRQDILNTWKKDTPEKTQDNRQVSDNIGVYSQDRLHITQSLNHKLGLRESSLPGAQPVTVSTVQMMVKNLLVQIEGQGNPPDLMGVDDDQLLAIQNDL